MTPDKNDSHNLIATFNEGSQIKNTVKTASVHNRKNTEIDWKTT